MQSDAANASKKLYRMLRPLFGAKFTINCKCLIHMVALVVAGTCAPLRVVAPVFCGCMLTANGNTQDKLASIVNNIVEHCNILDIVVEENITYRESKFLDRLLDLLHLGWMIDRRGPHQIRYARPGPQVPTGT